MTWKEQIMTDHNFAAITFAESSKAYEALSDLRQASAEGRIAVPSAVILEREPNGNLHVAEGDDAMIGAGAVTGGLVGMFVGILGGPLGMLLGWGAAGAMAGGMLLGWGAGAMTGGVVDVKRADRSQTIIGDFSSRLPAGTTAIVTEVEEVTPEVLDGLAAAHGTVLRRPAIEVLAELEAAEEAAKAADREASRVMREERRQERKEAWDERVARLKGRFQRQS